MSKRLILQLLIDENGIYLSRGFKLQRFCGIDEVNKLLKLDVMANACDELLVLYVGDAFNQEYIARILSAEYLGSLFMPISCGGKISTYENFNALLRLGADKVVVSSSSLQNPENLVRLVDDFGSQAVIYPLQIKNYAGDLNSRCLFRSRGKYQTDWTLAEALEMLDKITVGELIVYDIERDGSGVGYNMSMVDDIAGQTRSQLVASGGEGKSADIANILSSNVSGACISNLFSFMGGGLLRARESAISHGVDIVDWNN